MNRPRVTLSVLLSVLAASISTAPLVDSQLAGANDAGMSSRFRMAALRIVPARDLSVPTEAIAPVIRGDLSELASDERHSSGLDLALRINEESQGLIATSAVDADDLRQAWAEALEVLRSELGIDFDWRHAAVLDQEPSPPYCVEAPVTTIVCGPPADATIGAGLSVGCGPGVHWPGCGELSALPRQPGWEPALEPNPSDMPFDCGLFFPVAGSDDCQETEQLDGCREYAQAEALAAYPELEQCLAPATDCMIWLADRGRDMIDGSLVLVRLATRWAEQRQVADREIIAQPAPVHSAPASADYDWQYLGL